LESQKIFRIIQNLVKPCYIYPHCNAFTGYSSDWITEYGTLTDYTEEINY